MAKISMKQRELKREKLVAKFAAKREALKAIIKNPESSDEERWNAQQTLQTSSISGTGLPRQPCLPPANFRA